MFKNRKGFTLIELIIVIAILAVLTALAAPRYLAYINDANVSSMKADAKVLEDQVNIAYADNITATGKEKFGLVKEEGGTATFTAADPKGISTRLGTEDQTVVKVYQFDEGLVTGQGIKIKGNIEDYFLLVNDGVDNLVVVTTTPVKDSKGGFWVSNVQQTASASETEAKVVTKP